MQHHKVRFTLLCAETHCNEMFATHNDDTVFVYDGETLVNALPVGGIDIAVFGHVCTAAYVSGDLLLFALCDGFNSSIYRHRGQMTTKIASLQCAKVQALDYQQCPEVLVFSTSSSVFVLFGSVLHQFPAQEAVSIALCSERFVLAACSDRVLVFDVLSRKLACIPFGGIFVGFLAERNAFLTDQELVCLYRANLCSDGAAERHGLRYQQDVRSAVYEFLTVLPPPLRLRACQGYLRGDLFVSLNADMSVAVVWRLQELGATVENAILLPQRFRLCRLRLVSSNLLAGETQDGMSIFASNPMYEAVQRRKYRWQKRAGNEIEDPEVPCAGRKNSTGTRISRQKTQYMLARGKYYRFSRRQLEEIARFPAIVPEAAKTPGSVVRYRIDVQMYEKMKRKGREY